MNERKRMLSNNLKRTRNSRPWVARNFRPTSLQCSNRTVFVLFVPIVLILPIYLHATNQLAAWHPSTPQDRTSTELAEQQALVARGKGDRQAALDILLHAVKASPDDPRLLLDVGTVELEMGWNLNALKVFQQAHKLQSGNLQILYGLARAELAVQDMPSAERDMRQYLAQRNDDPTAHFGLGRVLQMLERTEEARKEFQRSIDLQPNQTESYYELGDIAVNDADYQQGASQFRKVLEHDPNHGGAWTGLGIIAYRRKNFDEADGYLRSAVKSAPTYQPAHYYYGLNLKRLGKQVESERELQIALDLDTQAKAAQSQPRILESPSAVVPSQPR
jgi:tetratricopeptide (TPR) repeat protein